MRFPFPFETENVSQMSDRELSGLLRELYYLSFWERERHIRDLADRVTQWWERERELPGPRRPMIAPVSRSTFRLPTGRTSTLGFFNYRNIELWLPPHLHPEQARFLFEVMIREQMEADCDDPEL